MNHEPLVQSTNHNAKYDHCTYDMAFNSSLAGLV